MTISGNPAHRMKRYSNSCRLHMRQAPGLQTGTAKSWKETTGSASCRRMEANEGRSCQKISDRTPDKPPINDINCHRCEYFSYSRDPARCIRNCSPAPPRNQTVSICKNLLPSNLGTLCGTRAANFYKPTPRDLSRILRPDVFDITFGGVGGRFDHWLRRAPLVTGLAAF